MSWLFKCWKKSIKTDYWVCLQMFVIQMGETSMADFEEHCRGHFADYIYNHRDVGKYDFVLFLLPLIPSS